MHAADYYDQMIQEFRGLIETNLPGALTSAGIPKEDHRSIIDRVLGRLPTSATASDGKGLDPALVVGLGLLEAPRRERGFTLAPVDGDVRRSYGKYAFADYTWDDESYLGVDFAELPEALDLIMVTRDIGSDTKVDIVALVNQIDVFRQTVKSPLVTRLRALAAYMAMQPGHPSCAAGRLVDCVA